jgi:lysophospholipid acyltransferase (LPLAT)-like uncharacterized protein
MSFLKKSNLVADVTAFLISAYAYLCGSLTKYYFLKSGVLPSQVIYAFWHNQQSLLLFPHRKLGGLAVLVSKSRDGEFMARALRYFNMTAVRGSSSRGAYSALRVLFSAAERGLSPVITPDGPRGPVYTARSGVIYLAQKTGLPIIPVGVASNRSFSVNSWDKFQIPIPFGKCAVVYGESMKVGKGEEDFDVLCEILTKKLNDATEKAKSLILR